VSVCPKSGTDKDCGVDHPGCVAHSRSGNPCRGFVMRGTNPPRCRMHVGRRAADVRNEYEQARVTAAQFEEARRASGAPQFATAEQIFAKLLQVFADMSEWAEFCKVMVSELDEVRFRSRTGSEELRSEIKLYTESLERVVRAGSDLIKLGIESRMAALAESDGRLVAQVLRNATGDVLESLMEAGLTMELANVFRASVSEAVPRHLRMLTSNGAGP
jgi:hypothetical protein